MSYRRADMASEERPGKEARSDVCNHLVAAGCQHLLAISVAAGIEEDM